MARALRGVEGGGRRRRGARAAGRGARARASRARRGGGGAKARPPRGAGCRPRGRVRRWRVRRLARVGRLVVGRVRRANFDLSGGGRGGRGGGRRTRRDAPRASGVHALSAGDTATARARAAAAQPRTRRLAAARPQRARRLHAQGARKVRGPRGRAPGANERAHVGRAPLPASSAAGLTPARSAPAAGAEQLVLRQRLEDVQRHFAENREGYSRSLRAAAL